MIQVQTFEIQGMTCASCVRNVERVVQKVPGVKSVSVNLATEKAAVNFETDQVRVSTITAAVAKAGYQAELARDDRQALEERQAAKQAELASLWRRFTISAFLTLPLLYLAMGSMLGLPLPGFLAPMESPISFSLFSLALTIPVVVLGWRFYRIGFPALIKGSPSMDSLIALGTTAAIGYSLYSTIRVLTGDHAAADRLYYETAAVILTLITLGKALEAMSLTRTGAALRDLLRLRPTTAKLLLTPSTGVQASAEIEAWSSYETKLVPAGDLVPDDILVVKPGEQVPVDGVLLSDFASLDESLLSGESLPVDKATGASLTGGTINQGGVLFMRATGVGADTVIERIIGLVEAAQGSKAPIARLADTISAWFVPVVLGLAVVVALVWLIAGHSLGFALTTLVAILVIACPCALGLATPVAVMVGTGRAANLGILFKNAAALENARRIDTVVFDKTGTITQGRLELIAIHLATPNQSTDEILALAAAVERGSEHPVGQAIVRAARNLDIPPFTDFAALPGHGVRALVASRDVAIGTEAWLATEGVGGLDALKTAANEALDRGFGLLFMAIDGQAAALLTVADQLRPTSQAAVRGLQAIGLRTILLSGDRQATAQTIADQAGIPEVIAEVLPIEKAQVIRRLQAEGRKVAMIGDGVNDAIAIGQADLGVAMGTGTAVAMEGADLVLVQGDLTKVVQAFELSRRTMRVIRQNLVWAFGYNVLGIPIAAGLLVLFGGPTLNPMFAAAAMSLSSVSVLLNALRLKTFRPKQALIAN